MSTKNVKAGLSKANVNAIAGAIGTATLNRLVPIFSTSVAYEKGQYTNYNNQLYRFTANKSAGAWDSTKVESASLNDLINDVNAAVESVTGKANVVDLVNGSLVVNKALKAKALEVLSELSGSTQDDPFIAQGTGTNNNTSEVSTSPVAKQLEKQGNTVVVNQSFKVRNTTLVENGITITTNPTDNSFTVNGTSTQTDSAAYMTLSSIDLPIGYFKAGHKYLVLGISDLLAKATNISPDSALHIPAGGSTTSPYTGTLKNDGIITCSVSSSVATRFYLLTHVGDSWNNVKANIRFIDLTQWFNGDIPQDLLDNPDHWRNYNCTDDSYNAGTIKNANGVTLVTIKKNVWDEETETGTINVTTGQNETNGNYYRSKNYTRVLPNKDYYFYCGQSDTLYVFYYDQSKNYLGYISFGANNVKTIPSNAVWLRFVNVSRNTYQNNFSLYLVYWKDNDDHSQGMDGDHYNTYLPYEKQEYNTGNEVLRSAGSVKDSKAPNGTITRRVGSYTFTGEESWNSYGGTNTYYLTNTSFLIPNIKPVANNNNIPNITCDVLVATSPNDLYLNGATKSGISINSSGTIQIGAIDYANISNLTGKTIYFELAEPTTEQGTSFPENIEVDDYGMMYWLDGDGNFVTTPQGCKFFYPADYVLLIDDLNNYTNGDVETLAKKTDLASDKTELQGIDTQLQNAIGGTLRQLLSSSETVDFLNTKYVDLGNLDWGYDAPNKVFYVLVSDKKLGITKILTTLFKNIPDNIQLSTMHATYGDMRIGQNSNNQYIYVTYDAIDNVVTFKNAMKGVLLAYEKASA